MKKVFLSLFVMLTSLSWGQVGFFKDQAVARGSGGSLVALPGASVMVCLDSACVNPIPVFSDQGLSNQIIGLAADANGNYSFFSAPGLYFCQISTPGFSSFSQQCQVTSLTSASSTGSGNQVLQNSPILNSPAVQGGITIDSETVTGPLVLSSGFTVQSSAPGNTDMFGVITLSAGAGSYPFKGTYTSAPVCVFEDGTTRANALTPTVTATTISIASGTGTDNIKYLCFGALPTPLVSTTTFATQIANNTSMCSTATFPSYCTMATPLFATASSNTGAQTPVFDAVGHVSSKTLSSYLYSGNTTRFIAAIQPWFPGQAACWNLPFNGSSAHPCVGYNMNHADVVALQHSTMLARGFTDVSPDWYGNSSSQTFINQTVITEATDLAGRCNGSVCPLHLMIMVDGGLISSGMSNASGCPKGSVDETTCITTVLNAAYDYIDAHWGRQSYYSVDPVSGQPITLTFITKGSWSGSNWSTIWTNVKAHMAANYATSYKVIEEFGNFTDAGVDGAYGWPQPQPYSITNQFCWDSNNCSYGYLNNLYAQGQAVPSRITMGILFPGVDGTDNNYQGSGNVNIARQCGQLLVKEAARITGSGGSGYTYYSTSNPLNWVLVATWNDYGEGTTVEGGVDNCYTLTSSITTNTLNWTLVAGDATYSSTTTIDHYRVWYADASGNLTSAADNIPVGTTSQLLSSIIPTGTWTIYVEMVGKPLIINRMSNGSSYTH